LPLDNEPDVHDVVGDVTVAASEYPLLDEVVDLYTE